jgi:uncharacterized protein (DUF2141 family)
MNRPAAGSMELAINDIEHNYGTLWIGLYASEEAFLDKDQAHLEAVKVSDFKGKHIYLNDLDYGDYAVALFHDLNNNGELDVNWLGVPEEPFAFSRPVPSKWRLPKFSEVKVGLYQSHKTVSTNLKTWWDQ